MIVDAMVLYEGVIDVGVVSGILFLLYSGDFVVVHRRFLAILGVGAGATALGQFVFLLYWPAGVSISHLVFILFVVIGLASLLRGYPTHSKSWFGTLFSR